MMTISVVMSTSLTHKAWMQTVTASLVNNADLFIKTTVAQVFKNDEVFIVKCFMWSPAVSWDISLALNLLQFAVEGLIIAENNFTAAAVVRQCWRLS